MTAAAPPETRKDFSPLQWVALLVVVCSAFSSQMVMPLWVGAVIDDLHLSQAAAGRIGSFEFMAVAAVSLLVALRIQAFPTRLTAAIGIALLALGNFASAHAGGEGGLIAARMLCGVGKGLVVAIAFSLAAGSSRPTRAFALLNIVYGLFAALFYMTVPYAIRWDGAAGAFMTMGAVALVGALFMVRFPAERLTSSELTGLSLRALPAFGFLAFAALIILWSGHNVVWTFIERIGVRNGMSVTEIGAILSLSAFLTIAGPSLVRLLDTRLGYGAPMIAAIVLKIGAVLAIGYLVSPRAFMLAVPAFMLLSLFITPYVMGILSLADPAGRLAAASSAAMTAGSSIGAWIGGASLEAAGWPGLTWASLFHFLLFTLIIIGVAPLANRYGRRAAA
ncbi:MFS transporter [Sphingomonas colocasiae]|uniref:MFS transporter n=1 Tax=Sphingomonas colocasiae TaxID=1848973 RepID=A0ABS7PVM7_9SPHN|nr:MFS transporter [Sphingomonas colocasiae]MBY8825004.1 MFS transporter [Sphingomonas colocasiae]